RGCLRATPRAAARASSRPGLEQDRAAVPPAPAPLLATHGLHAVVAVERSGRRLGETRLRSVAEELLEASTLCAISTVGPRGRAYVNTAYFAWAPDLRIIWLSDPGARHSRNLRTNASVAIAVYDSGQTWGKPD